MLTLTHDLGSLELVRITKNEEARRANHP